MIANALLPLPVKAGKHSLLVEGHDEKGASGAGGETPAYEHGFVEQCIMMLLSRFSNASVLVLEDELKAQSALKSPGKLSGKAQRR